VLSDLLLQDFCRDDADIKIGKAQCGFGCDGLVTIKVTITVFLGLF